MTCSDVCLDQDLGYDNEFYAAAVRRAAKEHKCGECGRTVNLGESYESACGKTEGVWFTAKTCAECLEIRDALICGEFFFEMLWDDLREYVYPKLQEVGPSECFAELKTKAARAKLHADFNEWAARHSD